ncbi:MAG: glycosyltransferase family 39 protein [Longimicrobiales bacterium]|nr:glycosyltransferase family 39 protein [Longimicrobiales bacterium]
MKARREAVLLCALLGSGLAVRLAFLFWGAGRYYGAGSAAFINNDSRSYTRSAINLLTLGRYTFDVDFPEASFGRLPGYPLFWGLHYLLFGEAGAYLAVAVSQVLLDTVGIYLIFTIVRRCGGSALAPWIAALVLAFYPFSLIWVTVSGTETLGIFLCLLFAYLAAREDRLRHPDATLGLLAGIAFLTRPYFLAFLPALALSRSVAGTPWRRNALRMSMVAVTFAVVYLPWPIRNWVNHGRVVLVQPMSAGYQDFSPDYAAFRSWVYAWQPGLEPYYSRIMETQGPLGFPAWPFGDPSEEARANELVALGRTCGTGFRVWMGLPKAGEPCDAEVAAGFDALRHSYAQRHPFRTWLVVPALNLRKALFKSGFQAPGTQAPEVRALSRVLFLWRSVWVVLGCVGVALYWRRPGVMFAAPVGGLIYFMFAFVFRQIEMRYLLQADVLLLVPASLVVGALVEQGRRSSAPPAQPRLQRE